MASLMNTLNTYINSDAAILALTSGEKIQFDLSPVDTAGDRFTMFSVSDPQIKLLMCDEIGGESFVQFDAWGLQRYALHETLDSIMKLINKYRGLIGNNYSIWKVDVSGVRSFGTKTDNLYRFLFEATFFWSLNP